MLDAAQFPYTVVEIARGEASLMPMAPITLGYQGGRCKQCELEVA